MRKKRYVAALMAVLTLPLAVAAPAQAHVFRVAHLGNRAWTNTAHTRVGVEDRVADGDGVYANYRTSTGIVGRVSDPNGSRYGHGAAEPGGRVTSLQLCEKRGDDDNYRNDDCTGWRRVT